MARCASRGLLAEGSSPYCTILMLLKRRVASQPPSNSSSSLIANVLCCHIIYPAYRATTSALNSLSPDPSNMVNLLATTFFEHLDSSYLGHFGCLTFSSTCRINSPQSVKYCSLLPLMDVAPLADSARTREASRVCQEIMIPSTTCWASFIPDKPQA